MIFYFLYALSFFDFYFPYNSKTFTTYGCCPPCFYLIFSIKFNIDDMKKLGWYVFSDLLYKKCYFYFLYFWQYLYILFWTMTLIWQQYFMRNMDKILKNITEEKLFGSQVGDYTLRKISSWTRFFYYKCA